MENYSVGQKISFVKIVGEIRVGKELHWMLLCDCGKEFTRSKCSFKTRPNRPGRVKSCGCKTKYSKQLAWVVNGRQITDKYTYTSFRAMKQRTSPKNSDYKYYKDRSVCPRWLDKQHGFKNFLEDMGPRPRGMTIERINNDLGYNKENCKWATRSEQGKNTKKVHNQKNKEIKKLCLDNGIKFHTIDEYARRHKTTVEFSYDRYIKKRELNK